MFPETSKSVYCLFPVPHLGRFRSKTDKVRLAGDIDLKGVARSFTAL
jgi:hypothetical protein